MDELKYIKEFGSKAEIKRFEDGRWKASFTFWHKENNTPLTVGAGFTVHNSLNSAIQSAVEEYLEKSGCSCLPPMGACSECIYSDVRSE